MKSATITCGDALAVLVGDPDEQAPTEVSRARAHASVCPRCAVAFDDPDASRRVLASLARERAGVSMTLRAVLVLMATAQVVVASPWLFGSSIVPDQHVAVAHLTRDGALGLIIATVALLVAWRPRYALAATLIGSMVLVTQFAAGLVDNQDRSVNAGFELTHLLVLAILALLAIMTSATRRDTPDGRRNARALHSL
jgi:hypothetical protein